MIDALVVHCSNGNLVFVPAEVDTMKTYSFTNTWPKTIDKRAVVCRSAFSAQLQSANRWVRNHQQGVINYLDLLTAGEAPNPRASFATDIGQALGVAVPGQGGDFQTLWDAKILQAKGRCVERTTSFSFATLITWPCQT